MIRVAGGLASYLILKQKFLFGSLVDGSIDDFDADQSEGLSVDSDVDVSAHAASDSLFH